MQPQNKKTDIKNIRYQILHDRNERDDDEFSWTWQPSGNGPW